MEHYRLLALPPNITPSWKNLPGTNDLAYFAAMSVTKDLKGFHLSITVSKWQITKMFVPHKPFHPSLILVSKGRAYRSGAL